MPWVAKIGVFSDFMVVPYKCLGIYFFDPLRATIAYV